VNSLLLQAITNPDACVDFTPGEWDVLIPQARNSFLLATLYRLLEDRDLLDKIPLPPRNHLFSGVVTHDRQILSLDYEVKWLLRAVEGLEVPLVLLKGGAYIQAQLPAAGGRLISDIDLLVPESRINAVEAAFNEAGWLGGHTDSYDERYYRQWMHEIPPLSHIDRGSTLDVHHTIIPPTANPNTDASKLFAAARQLRPGLLVLAPMDMVIHSATHLFHEGDFNHGFRDVLDLDRLLRHFAETEPGFWDELVPRAIELDLLKSLFYGLRYSHKIFGTPIPQKVLAASYAGVPVKALVPLMDFLFMRALAPDHFTCARAFDGAARFCLYVRSHYLRMPMNLLIVHLARKAWKRRFTKKVDVEDPEYAQDAEQP
jgi:hypothetical protein